METRAHQLAWLTAKWMGRGMLGLAAATFVIHWFIPKIRRWYNPQNRAKTSAPATQTIDRSNAVSGEQRTQQEEYLHKKFQERHRTKIAGHRRRHLPQDGVKIKKGVYRSVEPAWKGKGPVLQQVVSLPDEPLENDEESVCVVLRSPKNTMYRRRFRLSDTVQTLLDFMTMNGFTQTVNTLVTSYPRRDLAYDKHRTLQEMNFIGGVTLNIEDKDL